MTAELEKLKGYFIDPTSMDNSQLASLVGDTLQVMAEVYATGGRIDGMDTTWRRWLNEVSHDPQDLHETIGLVLRNEAATRRFDQKFAGQIHPQGNIVGIIGQFIGTYMNTNSVVAEVSKAENSMEREVVEWLAETFGYNKTESSGNIVVGGTTANIAAMWVAREKLLAEGRREGKHLNGKGLYVLSTGLAHYSIKKACDMLGLHLVEVPSRDFKTDPSRMDSAIQEIKKAHGNVVAMVGLAGETETGLVDNIKALAEVAKRNGVYFHVDAAYGGGFILSGKQALFEGISQADSITVDPHKMFYIPYSAGAILFKDKTNHALIDKCMREKARYLLPEELRREMSSSDQTVNFGMTRVEGSMGTGGVIASWATIKLFGKEGLKVLLDHSIELTCKMYENISKSRYFRPLYVPETNTLLIGLRPDLGLGQKQDNHLIDIVRQRVEDKTGYYVSTNGEIDHGKNALRFVAMHPYTSEEDINKIVEALEAEAAHFLDEL